MAKHDPRSAAGRREHRPGPLNDYLLRIIIFMIVLSLRDMQNKVEGLRVLGGGGGILSRSWA